jgi:hypothetical protein
MSRRTPNTMYRGRPPSPSETQRLLENELARQSSADPRIREYDPLIPASSSSSSPSRAYRYRVPGLGDLYTPPRTRSPAALRDYNPSYENPSLLSVVMEKVKSSRLVYWADKLATTSEPGLSSAELMLTNEDLKPVEPEHRTWGTWNFIYFWICEFPLCRAGLHPLC